MRLITDLGISLEDLSFQIDKEDSDKILLFGKDGVVRMSITRKELSDLLNKGYDILKPDTTLKKKMKSLNRID